MGDPRKLRNKYSRPRKLWDAQRISEQKTLKNEYGLKNMRELWIALADLKKYRREARRLLSLTEEARKTDAAKILSKLRRLNMLNEGANLDDVLSLGPRHVLERRLQTLVCRKGLAHSMPQARQLITHGYIAINGMAISAPGYQVDSHEENVLSHSKPIDIMKKKKEKSSGKEKTEQKEKTKGTEATAETPKN